MTRTVCTTQDEVDRAATAGDTIVIDDTWADKDWPIIRGSAHAVLRGSAHAELRESAHAVLWESAHAELWESAHAVLRGSSHAVLRGSAHAELWGSAHAELWGSAHAELRESAHAVLWGRHTVAHDRSDQCTIDGIGQRVTVRTDTAADWLDYHGVEAVDGHVTLYKAVGPDWLSGYEFAYQPGSKVEAPDWRADGRCGGGLHLCADPHAARWWRREDDTRVVACRVAVADLDVIDDGKVKARAVEVVAWTHRVDRALVVAVAEEQAR